MGQCDNWPLSVCETRIISHPIPSHSLSIHNTTPHNTSLLSRLCTSSRHTHNRRPSHPPSLQPVPPPIVVNMSTEYNYDEQGQFFPYFILTITGIITLPLTYSAFRSPKELENTAPRIRSDFKPHDSDLIDAQKKSRKRRERKMKRMLFSGLGWLLMSYMVYLMVVTARHVPKIWDPYDVLGVTRVSVACLGHRLVANLPHSLHPKNRSNHITENSRSHSIRTKPRWTLH